jgi:hypothetical protein
MTLNQLSSRSCLNLGLKDTVTRQCRPHNGLPFLFDMFLQDETYMIGVIAGSGFRGRGPGAFGQLRLSLDNVEWCHACSRYIGMPSCLSCRVLKFTANDSRLLSTCMSQRGGRLRPSH